MALWDIIKQDCPFIPSQYTGFEDGFPSARRPTDGIIDLMEYASDAIARYNYVPTTPVFGTDFLPSTDTGITSVGHYDGDDYDDYRACDNDEAKGWDTYGVAAGTRWWQVDLGVGVTKVLSRFRAKSTLESGSDYGLKTFNIEGSNDGANWTTIKACTQANNGDWQNHDTTNTTAYRYYQLDDITSYKDATVGIKEMEMLETAATGILDAYSGSVHNQGSYSLKVVAAQTTSENETLTRTVSPVINLSDQTALHFDIYASRTGTGANCNIRIAIHDAGGTTTTKDIPVSVANTWETVVWDISGVTNDNKDAIDSIIITILNADAVNTFYLDNFHSTTSLTPNIVWHGPLNGGTVAVSDGDVSPDYGSTKSLLLTGIDGTTSGDAHFHVDADVNYGFIASCDFNLTSLTNGKYWEVLSVFDSQAGEGLTVAVYNDNGTYRLRFDCAVTDRESVGACTITPGVWYKAVIRNNWQYQLGMYDVGPLEDVGGLNDHNIVPVRYSLHAHMGNIAYDMTLKLGDTGVIAAENLGGIGYIDNVRITRGTPLMAGIGRGESSDASVVYITKVGSGHDVAANESGKNQAHFLHSTDGTSWRPFFKLTGVTYRGWGSSFPVFYPAGDSGKGSWWFFVIWVEDRDSNGVNDRGGTAVYEATTSKTWATTDWATDSNSDGTPDDITVTLRYDSYADDAREIWLHGKQMIEGTSCIVGIEAYALGVPADSFLNVAHFDFSDYTIKDEIKIGKNGDFNPPQTNDWWAEPMFWYDEAGYFHALFRIDIESGVGSPLAQCYYRDFGHAPGYPTSDMDDHTIYDPGHALTPSWSPRNAMLGAYVFAGSLWFHSRYLYDYAVWKTARTPEVDHTIPILDEFLLGVNFTTPYYESGNGSITARRAFNIPLYMEVSGCVACMSRYTMFDADVMITGPKPLSFGM